MDVGSTPSSPALASRPAGTGCVTPTTGARTLEQLSRVELINQLGERRLLTPEIAAQQNTVEVSELVALLRPPKRKRSEAGAAHRTANKKARKQQKRAELAATNASADARADDVVLAVPELLDENQRLHRLVESTRKRIRRDKKAALDKGKQLGRSEVKSARRSKTTAKALRNTAGAARRDRAQNIGKARGNGGGGGRVAQRRAQQHGLPPPPLPQHRRHSRQGQQQWRPPRHSSQPPQPPHRWQSRPQQPLRPPPPPRT